MTMSMLVSLECPVCGELFEADHVQTICAESNSPLLARYDIKKLAGELDRDQLAERPKGLWRWAELLPVVDPEYRFSLGEGGTPLLKAGRIGGALGLKSLFIKDESGNPTGTFKARGMAVAVSRAYELGVREFVTPTAGNAGGALAAYAARAGAEAHVYMPADAPPINVIEVEAAGADLHLVDGLIDLAGRQAAEASKEHGWFDVSTLKEPFRLEGKKTMGLELAQQFGWTLPDVILYPTGGGTGLIGMWKAFDELEELGWIDGFRPRMVAVQAAGCAPIVKAFEEGAQSAEIWQNAQTYASGLRVPGAFADRLILEAIRASNGTAISVSDDEIRSAYDQLARSEGLLACPEGAATLAGLRKLVDQKWVEESERIVLFNTGSGLKYLS